MKISIIHPSRSRPDMALKTATKWIEKAGMEVEYIISVDGNDPDISKYRMIYDCIPVSVIVSDNKSAIEAINNGTKHTSGDLLVVVSDDFDCPDNWAVKLLKELEGKSDFLVKTQDGIQITLITLPIMDRVYYERFGYIYHSSYVHMSSDVEMTMVGYALDRIITLPLLFPHNHYSVGGIEKDEISIRNDKSYNQGYKNLEARKRVNFDLKKEDIVKNYNLIKWH